MPDSIHHILREGSTFKVNGSLWIECDEERYFGPGRVELLERIDKTGSIKQAAKQMNMSYKKAWEMISALNAKSARPVVIAQTGGEKGGGSKITDEARELILYHQEMRKRFRDFLHSETKRLE
jgi:molybdate transport system regulatory protein